MSAAERLLTVLGALAAAKEPAGVMRLSEELEEPPSAIHRALAMLASRDLVTQDEETRKYSLGPGVLRLANAYVSQNSVAAIAQPHLSRLASELHETAYLTEWIGNEAVVVSVAESARAIRFSMRIGERMPVHAAASARAILAFRSDDEIDASLHREAMRRYTSVTPETLDAARAEITRARSRGFAVCDEEMEVGVTAVSAPIRESGGRAVASVSIIAPHVRLEGEPLSRAAQMLIEVGDAVSAGIGFSADPGSLLA